jgi:hypothetical protein
MAQLVAEALSKDPDARPTIARFARELGAIASGVHTAGGLAVAPERSRRRVLAVSAGAVALVAAIAAGRLWSERELPAAAVAPASPAATVPSTPAAPAFHASIEGGMLTVLNAGGAAVVDLRVTMYDENGAAHEAPADGPLEPGVAVSLPLDAFAPAWPASSRPGRVTVQPLGGGAQDAVLR